MDIIRTTIIKYYDNYKKENPHITRPKLLNEETYNKLNKIGKKTIKIDTLKNWSESNGDIKNIREYCKDNTNKIPLNKLKEILNDNRLAEKYNDFQNSLFNWYQYKKYNKGIYVDHEKDFEEYFNNLETNNEEAKNIFNKIEKQNAITKTEETKNKQIEKILRDKEISDKLNEEEKEEFKKQAAEKIEKIASKIKNKKDDELKKLQEELDEIKFKPMLKKYIDEKVKNSSYSLDKEQLINIIKKDIEDNKLPRKSDAEKIYNDIKSKATEYIIKNLSRIKKLSVLTGYNNDLFNKLPPEIATIVQEEMNNKIQEDIRKKNRKYILPKDLPRWERATQQHNVNPMLGRGAWSN